MTATVSSASTRLTDHSDIHIPLMNTAFFDQLLFWKTWLSGCKLWLGGLTQYVEQSRDLDRALEVIKKCERLSGVTVLELNVVVTNARAECLKRINIFIPASGARASSCSVFSFSPLCPLAIYEIVVAAKAVKCRDLTVGDRHRNSFYYFGQIYSTCAADILMVCTLGGRHLKYK